MMLLSHLIKTTVHAFFRIAFAVILFGAIGAGVSLLFAYQTTHVWPPTVITVIVAGIVGVLLAYAAGLTVLVREATGGVRTAEHDIKDGN
jgi:membrane protein YdbS with pleckstrin-like domain